MDAKEIIGIGMQLALITLVATVGLQSKWREVVETIRRPAGLLRAIIAVNIVVPLAAVLLCMAFPIDQSVKIGLIIAAVSPLAPMLTGKLLRTGANASRVVGYYVVLVLLSVLIVPATIALLSRLFPADGMITVGAIAKLVMLSVLAPLAAGLLVGTVLPGLAARLVKPLTFAGYGLLLLLAIPILYSQFGAIIGLIGNGAVLAMGLTSIAAVAAGHWLGGPDTHSQTSLALAAATRHPGMAALIVNANFDDQRALVAVILYVIISGIVAGVYLQWAKRRGARATTALEA